MMILSAWILLLLVHNSRVARKDQLLSRSAEKRAGNILVIDPLLQIMLLYKNLNCFFNLFQYFLRLCRACTATTQRHGGWTQCSPTHRSLPKLSTARSIPLSIHLEKNNALFGEFDTKPVKSSLSIHLKKNNALFGEFDTKPVKSRPTCSARETDESSGWVQK